MIVEAHAALALLTAWTYLFLGATMPTQTQHDPGQDLRDRWNLAELYTTDEAWKAARTTFEGRIGGVEAHRGRLGESGARLLSALSLVSDLQREYRKLSSYARMKFDLDTREGSHLARAQEIDQVGTKLESASAFIAPEILALPEGTIPRYLKEEPGLGVYAHDLDDILRRRPHTLAPGEEKLLADVGLIAGAPDSAYRVLSSADLPWPEVALASGETVRLDPAGFVKHRGSENRSDRTNAFRAFFGALRSYERTFGVLLDAEVKKNLFYARARRYRSSLEAALDRNRIPMAVHDAMIEAANEGLPSLHRYLRLRARILQIADLGYHDGYAPLVPGRARTYTADEARTIVLESLAPLGADYVATLRKGYDSRWVDVWPSRGKRSGAYSNGSIYGEHPFILMNYSGHFDGVATLAHESGHAMHSLLANAAQPFVTADYPIFLAEVASTFNEALLYRHAIDRAKDDDERLALLSSWLDGLRGTFFRQANLAEFERAIHDVAERGETLTADRLDETYLALVRKYNGTAQGVCAVDDLYGVEWAYIPHFYADFYVFQYATGYAASTALAHRVRSGASGALAGYLDFLRAGGSDYPYELLRRAGVDLAKPDPYRETLAEMNRAMDAIEAILARRR